ncbi:hypothetical protein MMC29_007254, partial [Sticta canariensis]|nr:hypothetical protein [Sticta canariensis]
MSVSIVDLKFNNSPSLAVNHGFPIDQSEQKLCPQVAKISPPQTPELIDMDEYLQSEEYQHEATKLLSKSITYQTVSYDYMSDPAFPLDDPIYDPFVRLFHDFISVEFPEVRKGLQLKHINTHGLLYTWEGTDGDLKPTLLLSHMDVVPVEEATINEWTYNPWKGKVANNKIWGRGAFDNKLTLVAILESVEALLRADFQPRRTVLLSFNFDEEIGGQRGAVPLAKTIKQLYPDGAAVLIDEGSVQFEQWGADMVMIGVTEKDKMDLNIEIRTPGGHASQPLGAHTGIGIMSEIVVAIENHEYYTYLNDDHPLLDFLVCAQQHAPEFPDILSPLLNDRLAGNVPPIDDDQLALKFVQNAGWIGNAIRWSLTTAKSVTVIQGGSKSNSLPEQTTSWSDVRIHIAETTDSIKKDFSEIIDPIALKHNLTFFDFDELPTDADTPGKSIRVRAGGIGKPAKISPFKVIPGTDTPWSIVAGTTRSVLGEGITVVPGMTPGNTDARWYADARVSDFIYRYSPGGTLLDSANMHTVDESM